ncbi:insulinase family protein [Alsobacter sp. SYSU M60028]|uniref:Insulinase family protein n=1 Tax=Alsobacter ponti TaxID=2962936 RepID=A0ABT1LDM2_9HYPH|nr:pitrilysin family protein [Alsobacter ponti]MCP8939193.1 insulinase family protein [Alsobacter ponti]
MNAPTRPQAHASRIQRVVTPGGVEAWLVEDYTVPLVALEFSIRGGSSQDPEGKPGTAYFLSAVLDEGAGPYSADAFHERLDEFAIEMRFNADRDGLSGHMRTLVKHRAEAFDMLRLALREPRFDAEALERVRAQIEAGIRHEMNDPDSMVGRAFFEVAYPGHPYGRPGHGTLESLPTIGRDDLDAMRRRLIARDTLKIGVVGAIDAAALAAELDSVFAGLPAKAELTPVPNVAPLGAGTRKVVDLAIPQSSVRYGAAGISRRDPDWIPAIVVNHVLGGGVFSSRLFREVREKRGLAYSVWSQLAPFDHSALHFGGTSTKNERVAESMAIIEEQIRSLAEDGPTEEELDKARKYLIGSYALNFDTSTKIASQLVRIQVDDLGIDYMDRRNGLVAAVTLEDARRAARRVYGDGKVLVAVVGRPAGL